MNEVVHEFEFEQLTPVIDNSIVKGMLLSGTAKLVSNDPISEPHEFYVKSVDLDGMRLVADNRLTGVTTFNGKLFKAIADIIHNDRHPLGHAAQEEFSEVVEESRQPDPDRAYDERRDHQAMGWL